MEVLRIMPSPSMPSMMTSGVDFLDEIPRSSLTGDFSGFNGEICVSLLLGASEVVSVLLALATGFVIASLWTEVKFDVVDALGRTPPAGLAWAGLLGERAGIV